MWGQKKVTMLVPDHKQNLKKERVVTEKIEKKSPVFKLILQKTCAFSGLALSDEYPDSVAQKPGAAVFERASLNVCQLERITKKRNPAITAAIAIISIIFASNVLSKAKKEIITCISNIDESAVFVNTIFRLGPACEVLD